jgi:hypothetical protein
VSHVLPPAFLFRYAVPVPRVDPAASLLEAVDPFPWFGDLDMTGQAGDDESPALGTVVFGWSERGFGVGFEVTGKQHPLVYDLHDPRESDGLVLWLDTRPTGNVHRATRFCHEFGLLPGAYEDDEPPLVLLPIARAKEEPPESEAEIDMDVHVRRDGYRFEAWFPPESLHGYDPDSSPRLGCYFVLRDAEFGDRFAVVGPEFPFDSDPSTWVTLELVD